MIIRLAIVFLLCFASFANAEQTYIWTDENGQTHVSETEPENWGIQEYEETKDSQQVEILRVREEIIKQEQLKEVEKKQSTVTTKKRKG